MKAPFYHNVSSKYGAPMGRQSDPPGDFDLSKRLHCRRVPWVDGDYDPGGAYWGHGTGAQTLWCIWDDEGHVHYTRAASRGAAQAKFPGAKWFKAEKR